MISLGRTARVRVVGDLVGSLECWRKPMGRRSPVGVLAAVTCVALLDIHYLMISRSAVGSLCCCGHIPAVWPCSSLLRPQPLKTECVDPREVLTPKSVMWGLQWIQMLSMRHVLHRPRLPTKDKMAVVAGQTGGSFVPCRKSTCRVELEIPDPAVQGIEAAPAAVVLPNAAVECAGSYQGLMKIVLA
jgi:hypothetical protein